MRKYFSWPKIEGGYSTVFSRFKNLTGNSVEFVYGGVFWDNYEIWDKVNGLRILFDSKDLLEWMYPEDKYPDKELRPNPSHNELADWLHENLDIHEFYLTAFAVYTVDNDEWRKITDLNEYKEKLKYYESKNSQIVIELKEGDIFTYSIAPEPELKHYFTLVKCCCNNYITIDLTNQMEPEFWGSLEEINIYFSNFDVEIIKDEVTFKLQRRN